MLDVVPPLFDATFDFPVLGQTSDNYIAFDSVNTTANVSTVYTGNLVTGDVAAIDTVAGFEGVPSFTGDDLALVYAQPAPTTATKASLFRRPLAADHLNPAGARTSWLADAYFGVIYRRGAFAGPPPDVDLDGVADTIDDCRYEANPTQTDSGGPSGATPNGIGDACECGDLGTNGRVDDADVTLLRNWLARAPGPCPRCSAAACAAESSATSTSRCCAAPDVARARHRRGLRGRVAAVGRPHFFAARNSASAAPVPWMASPQSTASRPAETPKSVRHWPSVAPFEPSRSQTAVSRRPGR